MAITTINNGLEQNKGITYTHITDTSADWSGISNDTYFYNLEDDLPYYKNASGTVIAVFEEAGTSISGGTYSGGTLTLNDSSGGSVDITGVTSPNLYTSDDTIGSGRVATLTDTLTFSGGANTAFKLYSTLRADDIFQVFFNGGGEWLAKNGSIDIGAGITYSNYYTRFTETGIKSYGAGSVVHEINNTNGDVYFMNGYMASGNFTIGSNSPIGSEFISLQGLTLINDYLIQDANTSAIADGTLVNDSFSFHIDGGALAGRYKDNLGVVSDLAIGGYATDVLGIADSNGVYTFYSDFTTAMGAAVAGDTVEMFGDIVETGNVTVTIPSGVNLNMNGHTYTLDGSDYTAFSYGGVGTRTKIINGTIIKKNSPTPGGGGNGLNISSSPDLVDCNGLTVIADGVYCLNYNTSGAGVGYIKGGSFIHTAGSGWNHLIEGNISHAYFDSGDGAVRVVGGEVRNCIVDGTLYLNNGSAHNCTCNGKTYSHALNLESGTEAYNCIAKTTTSGKRGISNTSGKIYNCYGYSSTNYGIYLSNGEAYNSTGVSDGLQGIFVNQVNSKAVNCTAESSAAAAYRVNGGKIYNCQAICTWNDVSGDGIIVTQNNGFEIIDCYAEVVNSSAYAVDGTQSGYISGLKGKGMTTLIGTTTNSMSSAPDTYNNGLIA